ncbi:hypothetical protein Tco_1213123 [Tanacetum coccineum]
MNPKGLVELDGKNIEMDDKCLEVIDSFVNKDDEAEENKKRRSLNILDSLGEIHGGEKGSEMNKSNVRSLDDEYDMCAFEAEKKSKDGEAIESNTTKEVDDYSFVGHSMKKNGHERASMEVIVALEREKGGYENDRKYNKGESVIISSKQGDSNFGVIDDQSVVVNFNRKNVNSSFSNLVGNKEERGIRGLEQKGSKEETEGTFGTTESQRMEMK